MSGKTWSLIELLVAIFVFMPVSTLIHESGHLFFNRLFGGRPEKLVLGTGKKLFNIGIIEVRRCYFWLGHCEHSDIEHKALRIAELLGGVLFQLLVCLILKMLVGLEIIKHSGWYDVFISLNLLIVLTAMAPYTYHGISTDGMKTYQILRYGKPHLRKTEEQIDSKNI